MFKVHSNLAIKGGPAYVLWLYCRAIDQGGQGIVELNAEYLCNFFLNVSPHGDLIPISCRTLLRWASNKTFFRFYTLRSGSIKLYLNSLFNATVALHLSSWGAVFKLEDVAELQLYKQLKFAAYSATAQREQEKSKFAIHKQHQGRKLKFWKPENSSIQLTSPKAVGVDFCAGGSHSVFLDEREFTPWGASQPRISRIVGTSTRTVSKYLSQLDKTNQFYYCPAYDIEFLSDYYTDTNGRYLYRFNNKTYRRHTNLYNVGMHLTTMKYAREKFNKWLKKAAPSLIPSEGFNKRKSCH